MRPVKHYLYFLLLVLAASLVTAVHGFHKDRHQPIDHDVAVQSWHDQSLVLEKGRSGIHDPGPGLPRRVEKRHGKSLLSQAIAADYAPVIEPNFTYCQRHYSLFLPGGCARQMIGNFSLRGPPSLA